MPGLPDTSIRPLGVVVSPVNDDFGLATVRTGVPAEGICAQHVTYLISPG